jgi:hypothetical protein
MPVIKKLELGWMEVKLTLKVMALVVARSSAIDIATIATIATIAATASTVRKGKKRETAVVAAAGTVMVVA